MNPFIMFILAIVSPLLLAAALLVPPYIGIVAASYIIYYKSDAASHPLADTLYDVFYMLDVYNNLLKQWVINIDHMNLFTYSMPLIGLPVFFMLIGFWLTATLAKKLKDVFQLGVAH